MSYPAPLELVCRRCWDPYGEHAPDGGACGAVKGEHEKVPCVCPGFRWVDPDGPPVGSYGDRPRPV